MLADRSSTWAWTWNRFMVFSGRGSALAGFGGTDGAASAPAAVLGEIAEHCVHLVERSAVDDVPARTLLGHQAGVGELLEVKRQGVRRHVERLGDRPRREAGRASHDKRSEHLQADRLREGSQCVDNFALFHISMLSEL